VPGGHDEPPRMIVGIILLLLALVSVHVRRILNAVAMFLVCAVVWVAMCLAMPLESPRRSWRLIGIAALAVVLVGAWGIGELAVRILRHIP
jgi:hypothetical protein